ncbi:MAG: hypothetical protein RIR48_1999 [Bacteroidota bacterium]
MENLNFDVVICGGGPGGSACAMGFVGTNLKVAVIEKTLYPREKVCGDGMAPYIPKALHKMSPEFKTAFDGFNQRLAINNVKVIAYNGKTFQIPFPEPWFVSRRYHFDNFLYQQASSLPNVTFFLEEQVTEVVVSENIVNIQTNKNRKITSNLIIGCDGATSIVRRQLSNYQLEGANHCVALRAYYSNVENVQLDTFEFHFIQKHPNGYFWIFPSENGESNVGFGTLSKEVTDQNLKLKDIFLSIIEQTPHLKNRFKNAKLIGSIKGWGIPLGYKKHTISGDRFMLVGDAASVADPLSGEGIGQAIVTGRIAAFQAIKCFEANNFSEKFLRQYDIEVEKKWGKQNRNRKILSNIFSSHQSVLNRLVSILSKQNLVSNLLIKTILKFTS